MIFQQIWKVRVYGMALGNSGNVAWGGGWVPVVGPEDECGRVAEVEFRVFHPGQEVL